MSEVYTGLHGRSPYEETHADWDPETDMPRHFVPEGWEELDRGICPACGLTVAWNVKTEKWEPNDTLTVLVVDAGEWNDLVYEGKVPDTFESMYELNRGDA